MRSATGSTLTSLALTCLGVLGPAISAHGQGADSQPTESASARTGAAKPAALPATDSSQSGTPQHEPSAAVQAAKAKSRHCRIHPGTCVQRPDPATDP
jgi:hypothetical protein